MEIIHTLHPMANSHVKFTAAPNPAEPKTDSVQIFFDPKVFELLVAGCPNTKARMEPPAHAQHETFTFDGEDAREIAGELKTYIDDFLIELGTFILGVEAETNETFKEAVEAIVNEDGEVLEKDEVEAAYDEALEFLYTIEEWLERHCYYGLTVEHFV